MEPVSINEIIERAKDGKYLELPTVIIDKNELKNKSIDELEVTMNNMNSKFIMLCKIEVALDTLKGKVMEKIIHIHNTLKEKMME